MQRIRSKLIYLTVIVAVAFALANIMMLRPSDAHQGAKGVVKERMDLMTNISKRLKLVVQMIRGKRSFDGNAVAVASTAIAKHADEFLKKFPKGSGGHPSEATDNVWKDWKEFSKRSKEMGTAAKALASKGKIAKEKGEILAEFKQLAATCGACHRDFRVKK